MEKRTAIILLVDRVTLNVSFRGIEFRLKVAKSKMDCCCSKTNLTFPAILANSVFYVFILLSVSHSLQTEVAH